MQIIPTTRIQILDRVDQAAQLAGTKETFFFQIESFLFSNLSFTFSFFSFFFCSFFSSGLYLASSPFYSLLETTVVRVYQVLQVTIEI